MAFKKEFAKSYMQSISLSRPGSMSTPSGPDNIAFARLSGCLEIFKEAASDYEYEVKAQTQVTVSSRPDAHFIVEGIIQQFAGAVRQLARRHAGRPPFQIDDEYDVQDLLHAMLQLFFEDIRTEGAIVGTGGRALRIDFLLKEEQIGIEVKGPGLNHTGVIKQLNDDIAEYAKHLDCKTLFVLIYDPTHQVDNARGIEAEMSSDESKMKVKVFVVPR